MTDHKHYFDGATASHIWHREETEARALWLYGRAMRLRSELGEQLHPDERIDFATLLWADVIDPDAHLSVEWQGLILAQLGPLFPPAEIPSLARDAWGDTEIDVHLLPGLHLKWWPESNTVSIVVLVDGGIKVIPFTATRA